MMNYVQCTRACLFFLACCSPAAMAFNSTLQIIPDGPVIYNHPANTTDKLVFKFTVKSNVSSGIHIYQIAGAAVDYCSSYKLNPGIVSTTCYNTSLKAGDSCVVTLESTVSNSEKTPPPCAFLSQLKIYDNAGYITVYKYFGTYPEKTSSSFSSRRYWSGFFK